jgi:mannitol operon repressor
VSRRNPFQDAEPEIIDLARFSTALNAESDRGAVLIAGSRLDEVLQGILTAFLRDTKSAKELLEGFNAPIGTFASRVSMCHALGLIEDHEYDEITLMRKVRNEFGHKWKDIGFDAPKIRGLVEKLPWLGPPEYEAGATLKSRFNTAVVILLTDLLWRQRLVGRERVEQRTWPNKMRGGPKAR